MLALKTCLGKTLAVEEKVQPLANKMTQMNPFYNKNSTTFHLPTINNIIITS